VHHRHVGEPRQLAARPDGLVVGMGDHHCDPVGPDPRHIWGGQQREKARRSVRRLLDYVRAGGVRSVSHGAVIREPRCTARLLLRVFRMFTQGFADPIARVVRGWIAGGKTALDLIVDTLIGDRPLPLLGMSVHRNLPQPHESHC